MMPLVTSNGRAWRKVAVLCINGLVRGRLNGLCCTSKFRVQSWKVTRTRIYVKIILSKPVVRRIENINTEWIPTGKHHTWFRLDFYFNDTCISLKGLPVGIYTIGEICLIRNLFKTHYCICDAACYKTLNILHNIKLSFSWTLESLIAWN